ncbi:hypothetical protein NE235_27795 [Actinoallomurus spadix]|uniref:hypothetical protein n=1 Tax=Actinoallomurus spadix TaxID=79912 RepID=UPI002091E98B|nr:hypothetical protein [Actinoallomurus spadix]MCO5989922.1 hypothetical protein [Actinoallomurus spadix]
MPIMLSIDDGFHISVETSGRLVTPLGTFHLGAEGDLTDQNNKPLPAQPGDVTQLIICRSGSAGQCQGYQIGTGRRLHIEMDGHFTADVERKRIVIRAEPGSRITVSDSGPPAPVGARGPARIAIAEFDFNETGQATNVDLDRDQGGNTDDLSYDHVTGDLQPANGARFARLTRYREKKHWFSTGISLGDKVPGENECLRTPADQWRQRFTGNDLAADTIIACVKTAEGELGYLVIGRDPHRKPVAYHVYSYVWVR